MGRPDRLRSTGASGGRAGASVVGAIVAVAVLGVVLVVLGAGAGAGAVHSRRRRRRDAAASAADESVPELVELFVAGAHAGLHPAETLTRLGDLIPPPVRPLTDAVTTAVRLGDRFADALAAAGPSARPGFRLVLDALALAERTGDPIGPVLERLADEARHDRRRRADAAARQLPVRLSIPLVTCTLPAFVVLTIVPMLAGGLAGIRGAVP